MNNNCTATEIDTSYDDFINTLAKNSDDVTFTNSSESHALSILRATFKYSQHYVYMLSNKMDPCVFNDKQLISEARAFLEKDGRELHIAVQDSNFSITNCNFTSELFNEFKNKIKIMKANDDSNVQGLPVNFTIADDKTYRLENDLVKRTAIGCFSDTETTGILKKLFNSIFDTKSMTEVTV